MTTGWTVFVIIIALIVGLVIHNMKTDQCEQGGGHYSYVTQQCVYPRGSR
jgi:hypothetical protein